MERLQPGAAGAALVALSRCTDIEPSFAEARVFMGLTNALMNKIDLAIDHLELAARLVPPSGKGTRSTSLAPLPPSQS